jgi:D-glycero-D-manno-heptose 1,7-bisphosphate phosphatase
MGIARRRAVFFDRDGVINSVIVRDGTPGPPASLDELALAPTALESLQDLKRRGFLLFVATNQPDVARGLVPRTVVEAIHRAISAALPLDGILVCYHSDEYGCTCRKPLPGLLLRAARRHRIELGRSFMVGDRWRDVDAGHNAGCQSILVEGAYRERNPARKPEAHVRSLREAADWILRSVSKGEAS